VDHADHLVRWEHGIEVFEQLFGQSVLELPADAPPCEPVFNVTLRPKGGVHLRLRRWC
jgi:hypothetical protein